MKLLILLAISTTASAWYWYDGFRGRAPGQAGHGGLRAIVEESEKDKNLLMAIRTVASRHPVRGSVKSQIPSAKGEELLTILEEIYGYGKTINVQEASIREFLRQIDADGKDGALVFVAELTRLTVGEMNFEKLLANELWSKMLKAIIGYEENGARLRDQGGVALARNPAIFLNLIRASRSLFL